MTLTQMGLDEFLHLAPTAPRLFIYREITSAGLTPPDVIASLDAMMDDGTVFETDVQPSGDVGFSTIAFGLMAQLSAHGRDVTTRVGHTITQHSVDPLVLLRQMLAQYTVTNPGHERLLEHGAMGFLSYDAVRMREAIAQRHPLDATVPDMLFNFYHTVIIFDHAQHKIVVAKMVELDGCDRRQVHQHTHRYLSDLIATMRSHRQVLEKITITNDRVGALEVDVSDDEFMRLITQAKHHIRLGDAFQIVLSRCFKQTYTAKPFAIYRALRQVSPAPYLFYFSQPSFVMVGASPEKLVSVRHHQVEINPIAGTRARRSVHDENNNANELLADEKEVAEHMMLVDLARNDCALVCEPGTVHVSDLLRVKHFSHLTHLTSTVRGRLRADKDAIDALFAAFPAGTVSGAPKISAMNIIDKLETSPRGLYGGAFCRLNAAGYLDSALSIRMAMLADGVATIRTGAGIVADSHPESEVAETRHKAQAMFCAMALAEEQSC